MQPKEKNEKDDIGGYDFTGKKSEIRPLDMEMNDMQRAADRQSEGGRSSSAYQESLAKEMGGEFGGQEGCPQGFAFTNYISPTQYGIRKDPKVKGYFTLVYQNHSAQLKVLDKDGSRERTLCLTKNDVYADGKHSETIYTFYYKTPESSPRKDKLFLERLHGTKLPVLDGL